MITKDNFEKVLIYLGFKKENNKKLYSKKYKNFGYEMKVDFDTASLDYGEKVVVNDKTTSNFAKDENFVVFECVDRLLDKGYKPEDIELEPRWSLGHGEKSGKADIVVYDKGHSANKNDLLFIIECKTYDKEYDKEYKNTLIDGGQLFSYLQQERSTKWLSLYASDYECKDENDKVTYKTDIIKVTDDENILKLAEKDESYHIYKNAQNKEDLFLVWDETYEKRFVGDVIFSEDSVAYEIGIKPLRKKDLQNFSEKNSIVNSFEEILRHNNVSDKENAFNRLIALFIAKLADEIHKDDDDIVDFQYKVGSDTYETLQDRLQRLHRDGMKEFMKEEITYIDDDYAERLVSQYTGKKRKNMIESLNETIKKLKFYTNNDFAFKDVHNEELFLQNGKVLVEVVQLFEKYKIIDVSLESAQFLGDMFEQLLNQGFKQNEGQFFTPNQITRFVWEALPLKKIMLSNDRIKYPKVIDFACGAGHFIVQGVLAIKDFLDKEDKKYNNNFDKNFYGIEKDYRLARVSRVSLYMNDCDDANIIFGDGLDNYKDKGIEDSKFDILVANPPYSVKEFKAHLKLRNNNMEKLETLKCISNQGSEIETVFVERMSQLLKANGIGAVVLPSSLLNKDGISFTKAREKIIYNFKIRAIVEMGSKTFGATGTNTVIMFLEKYNEPPRRISLVEDSVTQIFDGNFNEEFEDVQIFNEYTKKINVEKSLYKKFIKKNLTFDDINSNKYFKSLYDEFIDSSEYKNKINQTAYKKLTEKEQKDILHKMYFSYAFEIEKMKIKYFAMSYTNETLIVTSPADNNAEEKFLGYKWSNRKGQEGIQILKEGGELYNAKDDAENVYVADIIRESFYDKKLQSNIINENIYHYMNQADMFDFGKGTFSNELILRKLQKKEWDVPTKSINELYDLQEGKTPTRNKNEYWDKGLNEWLSIADMTNNDKYVGVTKEKITDLAVKETKIKIVPKDTVVMSFKLTIGKVQITKNPVYTNEAIMAFLPKNDLIINDFLRLCLIYANWDDGTMKAVKGKTLNLTSIGNYKIPLFSLEKQKEIVKEFDEIEGEINSIRKTIYEKKENIRVQINNIIAKNDRVVPLSKVLYEINGNKVSENNIKAIGKYPVISQKTDCYSIGFVDNIEPITDLPVILFGDHTCCVKYINEPFVRGADGTKILKIGDNYNQIFSYEFIKLFLENVEIINKNKYERHYKYFDKINIPLINIKEQSEIVNIFSFDDAKKYDNKLKELILKQEDLVKKYFK